MLQFIKKIFQNEQQQAKRVTQISLQDLESWIKEKAKPFSEENQMRIEEILMKVNEEIEKARFNVEVLENAKLQNPDIPFRAKQYMEGNRKAYIRAINSFLGHMEINNKDYFYLLDFCKLFEELISELNKGTLRSYAILQEFFANETGKIAQNLKNFDNILLELKSELNSEKIVKIHMAIGKSSILKSKAKQKINMDIDLKDAEAALKLANTEKEELMLEIEKFNTSEEHNKFLRLNEDKKSKAKSFYEDEKMILQSFSALERPLRKYSHVAFEHEEIALGYISNPIDALSSDKNLEIINILKNLSELLNTNKIQIDDKKREKAVEEIKRLNKSFLEQFIKKYNSYKSEIEEIEGKIKNSGVAERFKNFNSQLEEINLRAEKSAVQLEKLRNEFSKVEVSIQNDNLEVQNAIRELFDEEIKIII